MSRSAFALKFKATTGETATEYLTRWRMPLAGVQVGEFQRSDLRHCQIARYETKSAFSTAIKRVMGCTPRQYGRAGKPSSP
ncbi:helix-turn-helix domain-containing protein [Mesorhizobium sp. 43Arga]